MFQHQCRVLHWMTLLVLDLAACNEQGIVFRILLSRLVLLFALH